MQYRFLLSFCRWKNFFFKAMIRPFTLFVKEPIIQLIGLYMTFLLSICFLTPSSHNFNMCLMSHRYGVIYLILTTIPDIFQKVRGESPGISGLHYIAHGLGAVTGAYVNMRTLDVCYKYIQKRNGGVGRPEYRLRTSRHLPLQSFWVKILTHSSSFYGSRHCSVTDWHFYHRLDGSANYTLDSNWYRVNFVTHLEPDNIDNPLEGSRLGCWWDGSQLPAYANICYGRVYASRLVWIILRCKFAWDIHFSCFWSVSAAIKPSIQNAEYYFD